MGPALPLARGFRPLARRAAFPALASRPIRRFARLRALFRATLWLALGGALALQLRILADGGLRLPAFAQEALAARLAEKGVVFQADAIWLDPRGRVLVLRPRFSLPGQQTPFADARAAAIRLDRSALLGGRVEPLGLELTNLSLTLPAIASPTGAPQSLLSGGEFRLSRAPADGLWRVEQASARILSIPASFTGILPSASGSAAPAPEALRETLRLAAGAYRKIAALPLDQIRVARVHLSPEQMALLVESDRLELPALPGSPGSLAGTTLEKLDLRLTVPFSGARLRVEDAALSLRAAGLAVPALSLRADGVAMDADARETRSAELALASIQKNDLRVPALPLVAALRLEEASGVLDAEASVRVADAPWRVRFSGSWKDRAGSVAAAGPLTPALLEVARPFLPEKARPVLQLTDPVAIDATAELAPGGRPVRVVARASSGSAVAGHVPFDRAGAVLIYEPDAKRFRAEDLLLVQADSLALGRYEMDTETLDYRFILGGRLRPMAIEGWFSDWWDHFWDNFHFGPRPADAEVDIQGMWRDPNLTTVFVQAASGPMRLRGLELDSLAVRVQVAVSAFDILGFRATRGAHVADGRFHRLLDARHEHWTALGFDVRSDFPATALPAIFPEEGPELIKPFALTSAPRVRLVGEAFGPGSATPGREDYDLDLEVDSPLRYSGFPLDRLSLRLERRDATLRLRDIRAGFASGLAQGEATIDGPATDRSLSFDLKLRDADLDLVQTRWREFQATRPPQVPAKPPKTAAGAPAKDAKPLGGRIDLGLKASGPLDRPLDYVGAGVASITGADLASIRMLGPLSSLLGEIGVGFTTIKLTEADARLSLERDRLRFETLRLKGPSALVEAAGVFSLQTSDLDFKAKVRPFEQRDGILGSTADFVLSPLSRALEVELGGTLDEPTWIFAYGPKKLFRRITDSF